MLTAAFAQDGSLPFSAIVLAGAVGLLASAQRTLSTPARTIRRQVASVEGRIERRDGTVETLDRAVILAPMERALRSLSWMTVALAVSLALARLAH